MTSQANRIQSKLIKLKMISADKKNMRDDFYSTVGYLPPFQFKKCNNGTKPGTNVDLMFFISKKEKELISFLTSILFE